MVLSRWAKETLRKKSLSHRVVAVVGARQSGKTALILNADVPHLDLRSLDLPDQFAEAKADPAFFVRKAADSVLAVDDIQKVPELIGEIKYQVDRHPEKGRIIICASSDYRQLPQANESLAGRAGFVRVRTMTEAEKKECRPGFLEALFDDRLPMSEAFVCSKESILSAAIAGGYPAVRHLKDAPRTAWFADYLKSRILPELKKEWGFRKRDTLARVISSAAGVSGRHLKKRRLSMQYETAWATLKNYWAAIEAAFLVDSLPGWGNMPVDRPMITPKSYMSDSGLMAHLLQIEKPEDLLCHPDRSQKEGDKLVETWVYNQLVPEVELHPMWTMHYVRTRKHEIDFLITNERGRMLGIEVKARESVSTDDFEHLHWFGDLVGKENFRGVVLYAGHRVRSGGQGCFALPMSALWSDFSAWEKW